VGLWASLVAQTVKNLVDSGSIPGSGRSPGGGHGYPLEYSYLENSTERGAWQATLMGRTGLGLFLAAVGRAILWLSSLSLNPVELHPNHPLGSVETLLLPP